MAETEIIRNIKWYKNYFSDFYLSRSEKERIKIKYVLKVIETQRIIPIKFFKQIEGTDGLYEIRVEFESNILRIFCCNDKGALVVLFNGFQKKTQKTPPDEIRRAKKIMNDYFKDKENGRDDRRKA
ncbi:MAG: type II toxin-antitoxin system RelE/ParE family toxin [Bacteroidales bacterium]|nr:type II toxin-antitoxin system RelE/ParE family toxin [Bacteroidales bacterium]